MVAAATPNAALLRRSPMPDAMEATLRRMAIWHPNHRKEILGALNDPAKFAEVQDYMTPQVRLMGHPEWLADVTPTTPPKHPLLAALWANREEILAFVLEIAKIIIPLLTVAGAKPARRSRAAKSVAAT